MIDYEEINQEIRRLETGKTTYSSIEKLAMLYIVQDHSIKETDSQPVMHKEYSYSAAPTSEFIKIASQVSQNELLAILDEHFKSVKVLYPKEYSFVIEKMKKLQ